MRSSSLKRCFFAARSSTIDSITRSHVGELVEVGDGADAAEHVVALGGLELALLDLPGQRLLEPGDAWRRRASACGCAARPRCPAFAATSATPEPMIPEPTIPSRLTAIVTSLLPDAPERGTSRRLPRGNLRSRVIASGMGGPQCAG